MDHCLLISFFLYIRVNYEGLDDPDLLHLLQRLLEKDPAARITMKELRDDPWITQHGQNPLISEEENCELVVTELTPDDIHNAIKSIASILTVVR